MVTNRWTHTSRQRIVQLAMLDFVARPHSLMVSFIERQRRWKALSVPLALLCALSSRFHWLQDSIVKP